jgi:aryl-alcohol dehydrogenase-like predicted oxidoreductase
MKQRRMGRTSLNVSALCLDAAALGASAKGHDAADVLDGFFSAGGNFIQCVAPDAKPGATGSPRAPSEELVGQWHAARHIPRERLVLAIRVGLSRPTAGGSISFANLVRESCEQSLRRLKTSYLDLIVCEWSDQLLPIEDTLDAFDILTRAGLVRYIAAGNFVPWRVVDAISRSGIRHRCRFEVLQQEYALPSRSRLEVEALAMCHEYRLGFIASSSFAGETVARLPRSENHATGGGSERVIAAVAALARERGVTPGQIALAWVLACPQVTSALVGPAAGGRLQELIAATALTLTAGEMAWLDEANFATEPRILLPSAERDDDFQATRETSP